MKVTKKLIAIALASAIAVSVPLIVCAETYDLSAGSVSVSNDATGRYVTQENVCSNHLETTETVIEMKDQTPTSNTIKLTNNSDNLEVTIKDVNINTSESASIEAAGVGSTTIHVDGDNTLNSSVGINVYGGSPSGINNLTLNGKDDSASLVIKSNDDGIKNINHKGGTAITISNLDLDIVSSGSCGIRNQVSGDGKLTIEKSDVDIAAGAVGIVLYNESSGNNEFYVTSSNVDVEADAYAIEGQRADKITPETNLDGCKIAESDGGQWNYLGYGYGTYYYIYSADGKEVTKLLIVKDNEPVKDSDTAPAEAAEEASYYRIVSNKGARCSYTSEREGSVLVINCERDYAKLVLTQAEMNELLDDGIDTVKFVTNGAESRFKLADVLAEIKPGAQLSVLHDGKDVTLLLGKEEANKLLG